MKKSLDNKPRRFAPQIRAPSQIEDPKIIADITSKYDEFSNKNDSQSEEVMLESNDSQSHYSKNLGQKYAKWGNYATNFIQDSDHFENQDRIENPKSRATIDLPKGYSEIKTMIGPTQNKETNHNNYKTINNKENFGGDMDDIEDMSEFVDENSRFVYTSDENSPQKEQDQDEDCAPNPDSENLKHDTIQFEDKEPEHKSIDPFTINLTNKDAEGNNNSEEPQESFQVYTVQDSTRQYVQQNTIKTEENKNTPRKEPTENTSKHSRYSKYQIPVRKTDLESVANSDIVNYESNDDVVSLTGDKKVRKYNAFSNQSSATNKSNTAKANAKGFPAFNRPSINTEFLNAHKIVGETPIQQANIKDEFEIHNNEYYGNKRDSDIVRMETSSLYTSLATDQVKPKAYNEEGSKSSTLEYQEKNANPNGPKAEIVLDANLQIFYGMKGENNSSNTTPMSDANANQELIMTQPPLNRISEEVVESKESVSPKNTKRETSIKSNNPEFLIKDSYDDLVAFEETEKIKTRNRSPLAERPILNKKEEGRPKTYRENKKSSKSKKKKEKLEKLKQLQELEKILKQKEQQSKRSWAVRIIQKIIKGHLSRRRVKAMKHDKMVLQVLRRILSQATTQKQSKFIKNIIFILTKASQAKLKRIKENHQHEKRHKTFNKVRAKNFVSINEARNQQYERNYKTPSKTQFCMPNFYIASKIVGFVRGWKIRKIMKSKEIVDIISRFNAVSISIKMSQFNPNTQNFLRSYMTERFQIVDYLISSIRRLYNTGEWVRSYNPIVRETVTEKKRYNPNVVVNLSMPKNMRKDLIQSTSTITPPIMHLNSINSHMGIPGVFQTPSKNDIRGMNLDNSQYQSPKLGMRSPPNQNMNFNPISYDQPSMERHGMNERYRKSPQDVSTNLNHGNHEEVRETNEFPPQAQASVTTFTPVKVEDIPIKPRPQEISHNSPSPEQFDQVANSTHASIEIPKYDFEQILAKALEEQGEHVVEEPKQEPKQNHNDKKFLKRKKVYDPREAIKKARKSKPKKSKSTKRHKSAFPPGLLAARDEADSNKDIDPTPVKSQRSKSKPKRSPAQPKIQTEGSESPRDDQDAAEEDEVPLDEGQLQDEQNKKPIKPKPFLKRKPRKIKFQKLNWGKVKSRTNCWGGKKSARSEHRDKSVPKTNKPNKGKASIKKAADKPKPKPKTFNNVKSRIDTGIRKPHKEPDFMNNSDSFEYPNQYNLGGYADESSGGLFDNNRVNRNNRNPGQNFPLEIEVKKFQLDEAPSNLRDKSNLLYEVFSSDDGSANDDPGQYPVHQMHQHMAEQAEIHPNSMGHTDISNIQPADTQIERTSMEPLSIDKLEELYTEIHPDLKSLEPCSEVNPVSILPQITPNSVFHSIFLNCYGEEIYDIILEELRTQYEHLCDF
ncbi:unnamed protein product [Moneuplotes crassus]|uniref:Uncharacterized protein n=1 Tax=Euplotes crassus TaxID=5936 RepID=A0AAD1U7K2_EUPCR|nr:unnamed protein product [Moneuplotes crassus]